MILNPKVFNNSLDILVKINFDKASLQTTSKQYISNIVEQLLKETDYSLIVSYVDSIKEIIKSTKQFLTTNEINELSQKILEVFDKVAKGRESLLNKKMKQKKNLKKKKKQVIIK